MLRVSSSWAMQLRAILSMAAGWRGLGPAGWTVCCIGLGMFADEADFAL